FFSLLRRPKPPPFPYTTLFRSATANAMYDRLVKTWLAFYSPESRPSLVLAHSAHTLMDRFNESLWSGDLVGSEEPDEQAFSQGRSEEHTSELQSRFDLVCRLLL